MCLVRTHQMPPFSGRDAADITSKCDQDGGKNHSPRFRPREAFALSSICLAPTLHLLSNQPLATMPFSLPFREHMPVDEQLARNHYNRFLRSNPSCKPLKLVFPTGIVLIPILPVNVKRVVALLHNDTSNFRVGASSPFCSFSSLYPRGCTGNLGLMSLIVSPVCS